MNTKGNIFLPTQLFDDDKSDANKQKDDCLTTNLTINIHFRHLDN